jgi:site-specific recombinase XerD
MGAGEINAFLSHLASDQRVSASTQNQALCAILFLYRHVLQREPGELGEVIRAKRGHKIPVILSPAEVQRILERLTGASRLMGMLLYGAGLRIMELVRLRLKDVDFDIRGSRHAALHACRRSSAEIPCMNTPCANPIPVLSAAEPPANCLRPHGADWPAFWRQLQARLRHEGYRDSTLRLYRQVLRDLRTFLRDRHGIARPDGLTVETAEAFLVALSQKNVSWSWMATTIAVLRTAFDRLGGLHVTARMQTPRRKWPLPEFLSDRELRLLFDGLPNPRDRLLVALLAGCGLRVSEACRIRWDDFDPKSGALRLTDPAGLRSRSVTVPQCLLPLFQGLAPLSRGANPMICGSRSRGSAMPLSARQAERIVQSAGLRCGILKRVTPMVLRHTCAIRRLLAGENIRAVQDSLGHRSVKTTLRYQACILPKGTRSPADPPPPNLALKQLSAVLDRLTAAVTCLRSPSSPQGP